MGAHHGNQGRDERTEQLRAEIRRLVADATDESRSRTYRDWCARQIPHTQALLFARIDRGGGRGEDPELSGSDATVEPAAPTTTAAETRGEASGDMSEDMSGDVAEADAGGHGTGEHEGVEQR